MCVCVLSDVNTDYLVTPLTLEYPSILCATVVIVDDLALETLIEEFTINVTGTSITGGANALVLPSITVEIEDNESNLALILVTAGSIQM